MSKKLPEIERTPGSSLPRMIPAQRRRANALIRKTCSVLNIHRISHELLFFLICAHIVLYYHRKFRRHLGAKVLKIITALAVALYEKVSIFKGFSRLILFGTTKSNTIFYRK